MNSSATSLADSVPELAKTFTGQIIRPDDPAYEEVRRLHNGLVDKRPAVIARCRGVADIVDAVSWARSLNLEVAVRGGGHGVAGRAAVDGGMMIDLSLMKGIHVDPRARIARAQGGVTWGEFNRETQVHGLATTGGAVSTTGIGGLTLGGGVGWLMSRCGLVVDNLLSVEIVTADGRVQRASPTDDADLFWAVRGAGANFGVATSLEYQLHPVGPMITGGLVAYPLDNAREVLRFYRDATMSLPDEFAIFAGLIHAPDGAKLAALVLCHSGPLDVGATATRPIKSFGAPLMDTIGPMSYCDLNTMLDAAYPKGALSYWKSNFLARLSDDAIDTMVDRFARCPSPMDQILLEHLHGAATRVGVADTAFPHRAVGYNFLVASQWTDPARTDQSIAWVRETYAAMTPF